MSWDGLCDECGINRAKHIMLGGELCNECFEYEFNIEPEEIKNANNT